MMGTTTPSDAAIDLTASFKVSIRRPRMYTLVAPLFARAAAMANPMPIDGDQE